MALCVKEKPRVCFHLTVSRHTMKTNVSLHDSAFCCANSAVEAGNDVARLISLDFSDPMSVLDCAARYVDCAME